MWRAGQLLLLLSPATPVAAAVTNQPTHPPTCPPTLQCVAPSGGVACPRRSYSWRRRRDPYAKCALCNTEGACISCRDPNWVVDGATGKCRSKTCLERDPQCISCKGWRRGCSACKAGYVVDWRTKRVRPWGAGCKMCVAELCWLSGEGALQGSVNWKV